MLRSILSILFLVSAMVVIGDESNAHYDSAESTCQPTYWTNGPEFPCNGYLSTGMHCNDTLINISDTSLYNCSEVNLFWNYPMHNLTLCIEAESSSRSNRPFAIRLTNGWMLPISRLYPNGEERIISETSAEDLIEYSDANNQILLKFHGPEQLTFYGTFIEYQVLPH